MRSDSDLKAASKPKDSKGKIKAIGAFLAFVVVVVMGNFALNYGIEKTNDATIEAHVIPVKPKVSGYVISLNIDDNQQVHKGDLLLQIDPRDYQLQLDQARAKLASARASLTNATLNADRQLAMGKLATSQQNKDNAIAAKETADAEVQKAEAELAVAEKNLEDTKIMATEDGTITNRTVEKGEYVETGHPMFTIVGVERWVVANFKEVQIKDMRVGQSVDINVDAYPSLKLKGRVDGIQSGTGSRFSVFPPENATGNFVKIVQRVPVKIVFDSPAPTDVVLGPGLSVIPVVHTSEKPAS